MPFEPAIQGMAHEQDNGGEDLRKFIVGDLPTVMYIPNFITGSEQNHIWHQINTVPMSKWKTLKNRRLQNWGGVVHEKGLLSQAYYLHGIEECTVHEFDEVINADAAAGNIINNVYNTKLVTDHSKNIEAPTLKKKPSISWTGTRISLTCRLVPKVNKSLIKL